MIARVQDSSMTSWPDHLPSGNQKRFWRDLVKRIGAVVRPAPVVLALHALFKSRTYVELPT
jgi:hypothetical protein